MAWFYKVLVFIFFANSFIALFATPQFNIWDKHYSSPNWYFNKTNMSVETMTDSQAEMYYGRNANVSVNQNLTFTSIFSMGEGGIIGILVNIVTIVVGFLLFLIFAAWAAFTFVGIQIVKWFGPDFLPIAILLQGGINIGFTYTFWQIITGRGGKLLE